MLTFALGSGRHFAHKRVFQERECHLTSLEIECQLATPLVVDYNRTCVSRKKELGGNS
jgi:hypothetical protein